MALPRELQFRAEAFMLWPHFFHGLTYLRMFSGIRPALVPLLLSFLVLNGCATTSTRLEDNGSWILHTINDDLLYGRSNITLHFDSATRFSGFAGCNRYQGEYRYEDSAIDVFDVETTTQQQCDAAIQDQETRYLTMLGDAVNYHEQCNLLRLRSADGDRMLFKREVKPSTR